MKETPNQRGVARTRRGSTRGRGTLATSNYRLAAGTSAMRMARGNRSTKSDLKSDPGQRGPSRGLSVSRNGLSKPWAVLGLEPVTPSFVESVRYISGRYLTQRGCVNTRFHPISPSDTPHNNRS